MKIELVDIKAKDFVYCTGDSGFCDSSNEQVKKVKVKYSKNTGDPYNVIYLSGKRKFDSRTGAAMNPPTAYYIMPTEQDSAKIKQDKIDKEDAELEIRYAEREIKRQAALNKLTIEEQELLGLS